MLKGKGTLMVISYANTKRWFIV